MADPRKAAQRDVARARTWLSVGLAVCLTAAILVLNLQTTADAAADPVLAVNLNGPATTADGVAFSAQSLSTAITQTGGFQLCTAVGAANPPASAELLALLNCFVWGSATVPLGLTVSGLTTGDYDVYAWVFEDNFASAFTLSINGATVADVALANGGDWRRLGPFRVTGATGFQLGSAGGDANVAALAVYPVDGSPSSTTTATPTTATPTTATPTTQPGASGTWTAADFVDERVAGGVNQGLSAEWLPDGRMLTVGKAGTVGLVDPSAGTTSTLFTIPNVDDGGEHGAMDIAVAPDFATTRQFYVYYSATPDSRLHIDRFTLAADGPATAASRTVIWLNPGRNASEFGIYHIGGSLNFGPDGRFYLSIGDAFTPANGQDLTTVFGKVLRINRDGTVPADNPFHDGAGTNVDEIWLYGVRNPFRASWDLPSGRYFIGDVGGNNAPTAYEELNVGQAGANYGWPVCEGPLGQPKSGVVCPSGITAPILSYAHDAAAGCCHNASITGGELFRSQALPLQLQNAYIYGDYARGDINWAIIDGQNTVTAKGLLKSVAPRSPVWISQGPGGHIYYVNFNYGGASEIRRLRFTGAVDPAPTLNSVTATPLVGGAPLTVDFEADVTDPLGRTVQYRWDFGDGTSSTEAAPTHVYTAIGLKKPTLTITAGSQSVTSDPLSIQVGVPPVATITAPPADTRFNFGEHIVVSGTATDDEALPADALRWEVQLVHAEHSHPVKTATGPSVTIDIDTADHALASDQYFRVTLSVTDNDGLVDRKTIELKPRVITTSLRTNLPAGAVVDVQGVRQLLPFAFESVIGYSSAVAAPPAVCVAGERWVLDQWSNGAAPSFTWVTPAANATLDATYRNTGADSSCPIAGTLRVAPVADRSSSVSLNGLTVRNSGSAFIFFAEAQPLSSVRFRLDDPNGTGPVRQQELVAPYDFAGGSVASANAFDLGSLAPGAHSIRVDATLPDGTTNVVVAQFTVSASAPPLTTSTSSTTTSSTTTPSTTTSTTTTPSTTTSSSTTSTTAATTTSTTPSTSSSTTSTTVAAPAGPRLMVSARNDRSSARVLAACSLVRTETVFVFAENDGFSSVQFLLDGAPVRLELVAPWDFAGGSTTLANGWTLSGVPLGQHTITAIGARIGGGTHTITATFDLVAAGTSCLTGGTTATSPSTTTTQPTTTTTAAPSAGSLRVSTAANRGGAVPLQGWVAGATTDAYIYLDADPAAVWVDFWLDDTSGLTAPAAHRELFAPWDFVGGNTATALPFKVSGMARGAHTVKAMLRKADGTTQTFSATFTV